MTSKKDCKHLWEAVRCDHLPHEDFEEENDDGEMVYFIVEETTYKCKFCHQEKDVLSSRVS